MLKNNHFFIVSKGSAQMMGCASCAFLICVASLRAPEVLGTVDVLRAREYRLRAGNARQIALAVALRRFCTIIISYALLLSRSVPHGWNR